MQVNTIEVRDDANADALMKSLRTMKSEQGLLRKGLVVYAFVGTDDALDLIAKGRAHHNAI